MGYQIRGEPEAAAAAPELSDDRHGSAIDGEYSDESLIEQLRWHVGRTLDQCVTITAYPCRTCGERLTDPAERYALVRVERSYIDGLFTISECTRCGRIETTFPRAAGGV